MSKGGWGRGEETKKAFFPSSTARDSLIYNKRFCLFLLEYPAGTSTEGRAFGLWVFLPFVSFPFPVIFLSVRCQISLPSHKHNT